MWLPRKGLLVLGRDVAATEGFAARGLRCGRRGLICYYCVATLPQHSPRASRHQFVRERYVCAVQFVMFSGACSVNEIMVMVWSSRAHVLLPGRGVIATEGCFYCVAMRLPQDGLLLVCDAFATGFGYYQLAM